MEAKKIETYSLLAILLLALIAFGLRVWGSSWGLPDLYHPDEDKIVSRALSFGKGDFNPHYFGWPSFQMYVMFFIYGCYFTGGWLLGQFATPEDFITAFAVDPSLFYLFGRWLSALLGSLTVGITYVVGHRLYGRQVGLTAAIFLAVNYLHIKDSHYITPDVPVTFMVVAAFWFAAKIATDASVIAYIGAGILTGLAISVKYPAFLVALPVLAAHLIAVRTGTARLLSGRAWLGAALIPLGFVAGTPYSLLDFNSFLIDLWHQKLHTSNPLPMAERAATLFWSNPLPALGLGIYLFSLAGLFLAIFRRGWRDTLVLSFLVPYLAFLFFMGGLQYRYLMPVLPFFCVFAARFLVDTVETVARSFSVFRRYGSGVMAAATLFLVFQPTFRSIALDYALSQADTRTRAKQWITRNIPPGSRIAAESYGPPLLSLPAPAQDGKPPTATVEEWLKHREEIIEQEVYSRLKRIRLGEHWTRYEALMEKARDESHRDEPRYVVFKLRPIPSMWAVLLESGRARDKQVKRYPEYRYFFEPRRFLTENRIQYVVLSSGTPTNGHLQSILEQQADLLIRVEKKSSAWLGELPFYSFHNPTLEIYRIRNPHP